MKYIAFCIHLWGVYFIRIMLATRHNINAWKMLQGGSNVTGTDLCVNKPHCAAAVRP